VCCEGVRDTGCLRRGAKGDVGREGSMGVGCVRDTPPGCRRNKERRDVEDVEERIDCESLTTSDKRSLRLVCSEASGAFWTAGVYSRISVI